MQLEIDPPLVLIKHTPHDTYHTFEIWFVPDKEEVERLLNDVGLASALEKVCEGPYLEARQQVIEFLDDRYPPYPQIWLAKDQDIFALVG